ncbi:KipI family sensor histidine kinase inhibitor [Microbacterium halimionae]|uniref:KipI family sensor histidine kinase inhibitor n=1 Tax=Microbacterium halimionae TaxID=1526413 RepID=A0A7W3JRE5_9MICO|nr:5-oxoprolinase/urea amidolyase family protein [Microbacterium halimionae]MBA8817637.1 KipI family sensor histidine kinase inhibitor [Microbacterium halimionae]NII94784.1 KipI family sensor histidine kinase inhibitor [Microbacterium halimionae]
MVIPDEKKARGSAIRVLPFGAAALLAEVDTLPQVLDLHAALAASRPAGVVDLVPAARTVLVRIDPQRLTLAAARTWITEAETDAAPIRLDSAPVIELQVAYDGPDLAGTASALGVSVDALVSAHQAAHWVVAFTGFAPGFGYLVSDEWHFDVPRLDSPRTRVPPGAVGLAGDFTGAYPRATPGGWRLIGTTEAVLFNPDAASPVLLTPGSRVRFVAAGPTREAVIAAPPALPERPNVPAAFTIAAPGWQSTVQDRGRPGAASLGIAPSGALDRGALAVANRLVGNSEDAAAIEVTGGGFRAVAERDLWIALAGARGVARVGALALDALAATLWPEGEELEISAFEHGIRAYLAVRGGVAGPISAGSRSSDVLAGLGRAAYASGDGVALANDVVGPVPPLDIAPWTAPTDDVIELGAEAGPRGEWFAASAHEALFEALWTISADANRVGVRLEGPVLERTRPGELPSEGMIPGAIQVPPSGQPTILLADGPVTGGYPVIAVVSDASLDALAQARPGMRVRFRHGI